VKTFGVAPLKNRRILRFVGKYVPSIESRVSLSPAWSPFFLMLFHVITCCLRPFLQRPFVISCYLRVFSWFFEPGLSLNLKAALPPGRAALPRRPNIPPWGARPPVRRPVRRSALAKVEALAKEGPGCSFSRPRGKPRAH
jgi:hypothetical protein